MNKKKGNFKHTLLFTWLISLSINGINTTETLSVTTNLHKQQKWPDQTSRSSTSCIFLPTFNVHMLTIYRSPSSSLLDKNTLINYLLESGHGKEVTIVGDFNLPFNLPQSGLNISPLVASFYNTYFYFLGTSSVCSYTHFSSFQQYTGLSTYFSLTWQLIFLCISENIFPTYFSTKS